MEEELKKDHSDMQAVVDSKQKIIDAQVGLLQRALCRSHTILQRAFQPCVSYLYHRLCPLPEETKGH